MLNINQIEFKRKYLKLTQKDISDKLGIHFRTYGNLIENQDFRLSQLVKMSEILEIPFFELFEKKAENGNFYVGDNSVNGNKINISTSNEMELLKQENKHLKEKVKLLENMIELFKNK